MILKIFSKSDLLDEIIDRLLVLIEMGSGDAVIPIHIRDE